MKEHLLTACNTALPAIPFMKHIDKGMMRTFLKLSIIKGYQIVKTVKEATAVCRSSLDGVVIFLIAKAVSNYASTGSYDASKRNLLSAGARWLK